MNNFQKNSTHKKKWKFVKHIFLLTYIGLSLLVSCGITLTILYLMVMPHAIEFFNATENWFPPVAFICSVILVLINWVLKVLKQKICIFICCLMVLRLIKWQKKHLMKHTLKIDFLKSLHDVAPGIHDMLLVIEDFIFDNQFWFFSIVSLIFLILTRYKIISNLVLFLSTSAWGGLLVVVFINGWGILFVISDIGIFLTTNRVFLIIVGVIASIITVTCLSDYLLCKKIVRTHNFKVIKLAFMGESKEVTMKEKEKMKTSITINDHVFSITILLVWLLDVSSFSQGFFFCEYYHSLCTNLRLLKFNATVSLAANLKNAGSYLQGRTPTIEVSVLRSVLKHCHGKKFLALLFYGTTKPLLANILKESGVRLMPRMLMLPGGGIITLSKNTQEAAYLLPETLQKLSETVRTIDSNSLSLTNKRTKEILIKSLVPQKTYAMSIATGKTLSWQLSKPWMNINFVTQPSIKKDSIYWQSVNKQRNELLLIKHGNADALKKINAYNFDINDFIAGVTINQESEKQISIEGQLHNCLDFYKKNNSNLDFQNTIKRHPYIQIQFENNEHTHNYGVSSSFQNFFYVENFASTFLGDLQHLKKIIFIAQNSPLRGYEGVKSAINVRSIILHRNLNVFEPCQHKKISKDFMASVEQEINDLLINVSGHQLRVYVELNELYCQGKISPNTFIYLLSKELNLGYLDIQKSVTQKNDISNIHQAKPSLLLEQPQTAIKIMNNISSSPIPMCPVLKQYTDSFTGREIIIPKKN